VATVRKNQAQLSQQDWQQLVDAINQLHGTAANAPAYRDFVAVHVRAMSASGMSWRVHTMDGMVGKNFLAWHRQFLVRFEKRLQQVHAGIALPYWDWIADRQIPSPLSDTKLLQSWSVTREWDPALLPIQHDLDALNQRTQFAPFQRLLEQIHNNVHLAVGGQDGVGTMAGASSPADPVFFLHHANIDRLWALWQTAHKGADPPNPNETLQPTPLFGVKVSSVLDVGNLGYGYG
jgi:tyrosinase